GQHPHLAVPERGQVLAELAGAAGVVDEHPVDVEVGVPDGHDPTTRREVRPHPLPQAGPVALVHQLAPGDDDHAGAVGVQEREVLELPVDVPAGVADGHQQPVPGGQLLDPVDDLGEVGVADVAREHADGGEVAAQQGAGVRVRYVVQLAGGLLHPGAQLRSTRVVAPGQDARRRGHRHTGPACDVAQVDRHVEKDRDVGGARDVLRIGIVGAESSHTAELLRLVNGEGRPPGARVVAVAPVDVDARTAGIDPALVVGSPDALVGAVDAALVLTRDGATHRALAGPLLAAGLPVWVDKPFATTVADARALIDTARRAGALVWSRSALRFPAAVRRAAGLAARGELRHLHL